MKKTNTCFTTKNRKSEKGMAILEAIPVLFMLAVIFNFSLGFFGSIHSGILNSIGSYNYTLETFRFRSNLMYFRPGDTQLSYYEKAMNRVHGVITEGHKYTQGPNSYWPATLRTIAYNANFNDQVKDKLLADGAAGSVTTERDFKDRGTNRGPANVWGINTDYSPDSNTSSSVTPEIWIKTVYGICLNAECKK